MTNKAVTVSSARSALALQQSQHGFSVAPTSFHEVVEFAKDMSKAQTAIPKFLRDNPGACMAVALQAFEWGMSPFAVANKSYSVNDRVAYEAQLIAAVVNTRSGIVGRLKYRYEGEGAELRCTVSGMLDGEIAEYRSPLFKDISPKNSPLWKTDPEQQLGYYSARAWARRHVPEVILGVYDREEIETIDADPIDITPPPAPAANIPAADVVDVEGEPVEDSAAAGQQEAADEPQAYGAFDSLGEYMDALSAALDRAGDEASIEEAWSEFDPMATLEGDDSLQQAALKMKAMAVANIADQSESDEPPSPGGLFRDDE